MKKLELKQLIREEVREIKNKHIKEKIQKSKTNRSINESVLSIAAGVILGLIGLKILKTVVKKVVGNIGMNVVIPPDRLKAILKNVSDETFERSGTMLGSDLIQLKSVIADIEGKIDSGEIKTIKGIYNSFEELTK
jgi:hypothetical protein